MIPDDPITKLIPSDVKVEDMLQDEVALAPGAIMPMSEGKKKKLINSIAESYIDTKRQRENWLIYRNQYQGIDPLCSQFTNFEKGDPLNSDLPGVTSTMLHKMCNIVASRIFDQFFSPHGDHAICLSQFAQSVPAAKNMTYLVNYYLRSDKEYVKTFWDVCNGVVQNGSWILRNYWNFKTQAYDKQLPPQLVFDPKTKTFQLKQDSIIRQKKVIADRPQFASIDPLFFALPKGCKTVNGERGAPFTFEKRIYYRWELEAFERRKVVSGFGKLSNQQIGCGHTNGYEPMELATFYDELYDTQMNAGLDFDDPMYRFFVDVVMEMGTPETPPMEYWILNGHVIRSFSWMGGCDLPYTVFNYIPALTTWMGISVPEIAQDHYREFNLIYKLSIAKARRSGNTIVFYPEGSVDQRKVNKAIKDGGLIPFNPKLDGTSPKDQFVPVQLEAQSNVLLEARSFISQQAMEDVGINVAENTGADLPSALRSASLLKGLGEAGSRPSKMINSVFGRSYADALDKMKYMIYLLQKEPIQGLINPINNELYSVSLEDLEKAPDIDIMPNANTISISPQMFSNVMQNLPIIAQTGVDVKEFLKMVFELGLTPEISRRLELVMASSPPPLPPGMAPGQGTPANPVQPQGAPATVNG